MKKIYKKFTLLILSATLGCQAIAPENKEQASSPSTIKPIQDEATASSSSVQPIQESQIRSSRPLITPPASLATSYLTMTPRPISKKAYNWPISSRSPMQSSSSFESSSTQSLFQSEPEIAAPTAKRARKESETSPEAQQAATLLLASSSSSAAPMTEQKGTKLSPYRIDELLKASGWSEKQLADKSGVSQTQINKLRRGIHKASLDTLQKIADAFEIPVENLFVDPNEAATTIERKNSFSQRLSELLKTRQLSGEDLAAQTGLSRGYIYELKSATGRFKPQPATLQKIAQALGVDVEELYVLVESSDSAEVEKVSPYRIDELLKAKGWSGRQLADKSGVSPAQINKLRRGAAKASLDSLQKIAQALNVTVPELFVDPAQYSAFMKDI